MNPDTLFPGVRIIGAGVDPVGDLLVRDGLIADFGAGLGRPDGATVVEAQGAILCPGLIDSAPRWASLASNIARRSPRPRSPRRRAASPRWPRCPTPSPRSTIRPWCSCCAPRARHRQPDHHALWRRHPRLPGRGAGRTGPAARGRRGGLHRWFPRDRPRHG